MPVQLPGLGAQGTHCTAGLPDYPAQDINGTPGEAVLAPEDGRISNPHVIPWSAGFGGYTIYLAGVSRADYFITHMDPARGGPTGNVTRGQVIGYLAPAYATQYIYVIHVHVGSTGYLYPVCSSRGCNQPGENCVQGVSPMQRGGTVPGPVPPPPSGAPPGVTGPQGRPSRNSGGRPPGLEGPITYDAGAPGPFPFVASAFANYTRALAVTLPHDLARVRKARYAMVRAVR